MPKKLRISIISRAPFTGGAEIAALRLAAGLIHRGHEVHVILGHDGDTAFQMREAGLNVSITPLPNTDLKKILAYRSAKSSLQKLLKQQAPDIILSNDLPTHQIASHASKNMGVPRLVYHRFNYEKEALQWFNKYGAEKHLFVSQALKDILVANNPDFLKVPCEVLHDGLELPVLPTAEEKANARESLQLPADQSIVLFFGQFIPRKGIADLLNAWALLDETTRSKAQLHLLGDDLAGEGAYKNEMIALANQLNINAHFHGFVKNIPTWLATTDLAVLPSHFDPLGNAMLESMSFGIPIISCHVGGIPEMVAHEQSGLLTEPASPKALADAITRCLNDPPLMEQFSKNARERCEALFTIDCHIDKMLDQLEASLKVT